MATFHSSSNISEDAMQTLYSMKPTYSGYNNVDVTSNMACMGQSNSLASSNQQYLGVSLPSLTPSDTILSSSTSGKTSILTNRMNGGSYNYWPGGNELLFLPSNDLITESPHSLTMGRVEYLIPEMPNNYSLRSLSSSSVSHEQSQIESSFGQNKISSLRASPSIPFQGLSLSLSSEQPSLVQLNPLQLQSAEANITNYLGHPHFSEEEIRYSNKPSEGEVSFKASSSQNVITAPIGFQSTAGFQGNFRKNILETDAYANAVTGIHSFLTRSKYLKAVQQLLEEVAHSVDSNEMRSSKQGKSQTGIGSSSFMKGRSFSETQNRDCMEALADISTNTADQSFDNTPELSISERQELQMKKAKLTAMLDEVNRRYRHYCSQRQALVSSFESAAGLGAAKTYTSVALQTISRQFRSLRDAMARQIQETSRALGEPKSVGGFGSRGENIQFHYNDIHQQKSLQFRTMHQEQQPLIWRPQRGLPERAVSILRAWLFEHFLQPYPKDADKVILARQTGLTRNQVSNWFINARVRLWKPMVEEMYNEEMKEAEMNPVRELTTKEEIEEEEEEEEKEEEAGESVSKSASVVEDDVESKSGISDEQRGHKRTVDEEGIMIKLMKNKLSKKGDGMHANTNYVDVIGGTANTTHDANERAIRSHDSLDVGLGMIYQQEQCMRGTNISYGDSLSDRYNETSRPQYNGSSNVSLTLGLHQNSCGATYASSTSNTGSRFSGSTPHHPFFLSENNSSNNIDNNNINNNNTRYYSRNSSSMGLVGNMNIAEDCIDDITASFNDPIQGQQQGGGGDGQRKHHFTNQIIQHNFVAR